VAAAELLAAGPLVLGLLGARRYGPTRLVQVTLLAFYPIALGAALAARPDAGVRDLLDPASLLAAGACLWAYLATTSSALRETMQRATPHIEALPKMPANGAMSLATHGAQLRALVIGMFTLAAVGIAVVVPSLGSRAAFEAEWGAASAEGRVLVSAAACSIACVLLATWLATVLRAPHAAAQPRSRALLHLSLALLGITTYYVLRAG
jgi:hypothetical protein